MLVTVHGGALAGHVSPKETFSLGLAAKPPAPVKKANSQEPDGPRSPRWGRPLNVYKCFLCKLGLTQMEELYSFLWSFLPAKLAKKTTEKEIFRSAEGEKRCLRKSYKFNSIKEMSMTDQANLQNLITSMQAFPNKLRAQVHRLREPELSFRPAPHEWSIIENIGHLIDVDVVMRGRIGKIIAAENAVLEPMDTGEYVRKANYQQKNAVSLLNSFAEHRAELIEELRFLRPTALSRTGIHPTRGAVSIMDIILLLARHDETHTQQIEQTLAAYSSLHDRVID